MGINFIDTERAEMINRRFQDSNLKELVIVGEDLRPFIAQIYNQDLGCLKDLRVLKIERC